MVRMTGNVNDGSPTVLRRLCRGHPSLTLWPLEIHHDTGEDEYLWVTLENSKVRETWTSVEKYAWFEEGTRLYVRTG